MTPDEITGITIQGARYLQAAQQDQDLNLRLVHLNYAVAYLETVLRYSTPAVIGQLTGIDATASMDLAQRQQNDANLAYMRAVGIALRVPMLRGYPWAQEPARLPAVQRYPWMVAA